MTRTRLWIPALLALGLLLTAVFAGQALAQTGTPAAPSAQGTATPAPGTTAMPNKTGDLGDNELGFGGGFVFGGQMNWTVYDAVAKALNVTPTQLFDQLHSGMTLSQIAQAQGVTLQAVQDAANTARMDAVKAAIDQAVKDGRITQDQANWMLQGLQNGWYRGFGGLGRHGLGGGMGRGNKLPLTPAPSASSTPSA